MTQRTGRTTRYRWAAAVVAVAAVAVAAPGAPAGTAAPTLPAAATQSTIGEEPTNPATAIFASVAEGIGSSTGDTLFGWGLSAIGLNTVDGETFDEIADELVEIEEELVAIDAELEQLDEDIRQQTCDLTTTTSVASAVSHIDELAVQYQNIVTYGGDAADIASFVDAVLDTSGDGVDSVAADLSAIEVGLMPEGASGTGVLASCIALIDAPTSGTWDDTTYYDQVSDLTEYYYGYQAQGVALLSEAYHYEAFLQWAAENDASTLDPADAQDICADSPTGEVETLCGYAEGYVKEVYGNLQRQFAFAGAPYTNDDVLLQNGSGWLFARSIDAFTKASGASCTYPLTSAAPCGPTVGDATLTSFGVTYAGYDGWLPAASAQLSTMLAGFRALSSSSTETAGAYLSSIGFADAADKIVITPTRVEGSVQIDGTPVDVPAVCFMDTQIARNTVTKTNSGDTIHATQPFCDGKDGTGTTEALVDPDTNSEGSCGWLVYEPSWTKSLPGAAFYVAELEGGFLSTCTKWLTNPGWTQTGDAEASMHQFHWPYFAISALTCGTNHDGSARSATNAAGVPTMCGSDFDQWFAALVPSPYATSEEPTDPEPTTTVPQALPPAPAAAEPVVAQPTYAG